MPGQKSDPLSFIPSAGSIRKRLAEILEEAAKLKILLRTAEEIEAEENRDHVIEAGAGK